MDVFARLTEQTEDLDGLVTCGAEPVRKPCVELSHLARAHCDVMLAEDQSHLAGQHVQPFVALMSAKLGLVALRRDDDFPGVLTRGLSGQWDDESALAHPRTRPDSGVADLRCPDQLV